MKEFSNVDPSCQEYPVILQHNSTNIFSIKTGKKLVLFQENKTVVHNIEFFLRKIINKKKKEENMKTREESIYYKYSNINLKQVIGEYHLHYHC